MKKNLIPIIIVAVLVIMLTIPLANHVLYVLFGIDFATVIVLAVVGCVRKLRTKYIQMIPRFILFWTIYNMGIVISLTRNILATEALDNQNRISTLIFGINTSNINIIISSIIFLCITITGLINQSKGKEILKVNWEEVKEEGIKEKIEFYGNLNGSYRFLNGAFVFNLFIAIVIFVGGSLTGYLNYGKEILDCIKESIMLGVGTSIIFQALNIISNFIIVTCFNK